jgi:hypothetical protein
MRYLLVVVTCALCSPAFAGPSAISLPEPGTLELLGLGTIVAIVVAIRRRK